MNSSNNRPSRLNSFIENPSRSLWRLAVPIIAGMAIQTLYTIIDMIFIGRLGGESIAAVAFNFPIFFFIMGLTFGLGSGVTASIARFIGANNKVSADNAAEHAIVIALFLSVLLTITGIVYGKDILLIMGCTDNVIDLSYDYLRVTCYGISFGIFSGFFRSILSGEGDMKLPMIIAALGTVLNTILDPIFIFTFEMGVAGAAWATTISQAIVFFIFVYMLFVKKHAYVQFKMKDFSPSLFIIADIIKVGLPTSFQMIIMSLGQVVFNKMLVSYSTNAVAAYQVGGRVDMLVFLPIMGIASALTTIIGMFYGAKEFDKIRYITKYGISRSIFITTIASVFLYICAPWITIIFTNDIAIQLIASNYLQMICLIFPLISIGITVGRILNGLGLGMPSLIITIIRVVGVAGPLSYYFVYILNKPLEWMWYSMIISAIVASIISTVWLNIAFKKLIPVQTIKEESYGTA